MNNRNYNSEIGRWLSEKRKESKLSQRQVAELMNVSKSTIGFWEVGQRTIFASNLIDYCKVIGADPRELVEILMKQ